MAEILGRSRNRNVSAATQNLVSYKILNSRNSKISTAAAAAAGRGMGIRKSFGYEFVVCFATHDTQLSERNQKAFHISHPILVYLYPYFGNKQ